jgi:uncharacterized membrane protein YfcA
MICLKGTMDLIPSQMSLLAFAAATAITFLAGFVKGTVGFAMPMIMISVFSGFLTPHQALAGLILPTLATNIPQALRQGVPAALQTVKDYRRFLTATLVLLAISAQFVEIIPQTLFLLLLGLPITGFAALQLSGRSLAIRLEHRTRAEWLLGVVGGLYGGVSGVWGPPLLVFLLSTGAQKLEIVRVQGVVFLVGSVVLLAAHLRTGVLDAPNLAFSAALVAPALLGQTLGLALQSRLDQAQFRKWTQGLLVLTGLNLIMRAAFS